MRLFQLLHVIAEETTEENHFNKPISMDKNNTL